jgi:hypothetical protein
VSVPSAPAGSLRRERVVAASRTMSGLVLAAILGGAAMGVAWLLLTPPILYKVRASGAFPEASAQERWFSADGWFLVLGLMLGIALGVSAWWRGRGQPLGALFGLTIGGLLAAFIAWWLGGVLGPTDPADLVDTAVVGSRLEDALGLRAMAVLLAPPIAGLLTFMVIAAAARPHAVDDTLVS